MLVSYYDLLVLVLLVLILLVLLLLVLFAIQKQGNEKLKEKMRAGMDTNELIHELSNSQYSTVQVTNVRTVRAVTFRQFVSTPSDHTSGSHRLNAFLRLPSTAFVEVAVAGTTQRRVRVRTGGVGESPSCPCACACSSRPRSPRVFADSRSNMRPRTFLPHSGL